MRAQSSPPSRRCPPSSRSRGQALVELALLLPILLTLSLATLDLGRVFYAQITISDAAREGALEAAQDPTSFQAGQPCNATTNRIMCRVLLESQGSFYTVSDSDVSDICHDASGDVITCPSSPTLGDTASIKVLGHFQVLTPLIASFTGGSNVTLSATSIAQLDVEPAGPSASPSPSPSPSPTPSASPSPSPTASASPTPSPSPVVCPTPDASFTVSPTSGTYTHGNTPGTTFDFTDTSSIQQVTGCSVAWSWSFGDGAGSSAENTSHVYSAHGNNPGNTYSVILVVSLSNTSGQTWSSTATQMVTVN